jgi:hypothetical protein
MAATSADQELATQIADMLSRPSNEEMAEYFKKANYILHSLILLH